MMQSWKRTALDEMRRIVEPAGYNHEGNDAFRRVLPSTFGLAALVQDEDRFMIRLSVGLHAFGESSLILSRDLHQLVSPSKFFWYSAKDGEASLGTMASDLSSKGLPWLQDCVQLPSLVRELEADRDRKNAAPQGIWPFRRSALKRKGPMPFALRVLSYCYEELGRVDDAVQAWRSYLETMTLGPRPEDIDRLRELEAKVRTS